MDSLQDAPDGSTIEAFAEESVVVRARVCRGATMATFFSTQSSAVASTFPSSESQYVQLPRRGSWMNAAKSQLGLHADRRVMARCLTPPSSAKNEPPSRIPEDLRHGDTLFFFVLEEDLAVGVGAGDGDGGAGARASTVIPSLWGATKVRKPKNKVVGLLPQASTVTVPPRPPSPPTPPPPEVTRVDQPVLLGDTAVEEKEAAKGAAVVVVAGPGVVTAAMQNQPTLGRGCGTPAAAAATGAGAGAAARPAGGQLQLFEKTDAHRKDAEGRRSAAGGSPPAPAPAPAATAFQGPYGITYPPGRPATTVSAAPLPPTATTPANVKMGSELSPGAAPLPSPRSRNRQPEVTATPEKMSRFESSPSACARGDAKAGSGKSPPPRGVALTASDEDAGAVAELVGMGFDREHVVRALGKCRRGDSWKESAISLLLEPQLAHSDHPETDLEAGLNRCACTRGTHVIYREGRGCCSH